jgi:hypothetical protein
MKESQFKKGDLITVPTMNDELGLVLRRYEMYQNSDWFDTTVTTTPNLALPAKFMMLEVLVDGQVIQMIEPEYGR